MRASVLFSCCSLYVGTTAIAEGTVHSFTTLVNRTIVTAIAGDVDLCVVLCSSFFDLLFDDIECVHWKPPVSVEIPRSFGVNLLASQALG